MTEQDRLSVRNIIAIAKPTGEFIAKTELSKIRKLEDAPLTQQITRLINEKPNQSDQQPEYLIFQATKGEILNAVKEVLRNQNGKAKVYFESLVLVTPEAEANSDTIDKETGIRVVDIQKGEVRFRTHPTPNS